VFAEDELAAFLDHRLAIEMGVAIRAAERAEPGDLEALIGFADEMDEADEFESYRQADLRFHMGLAEAAHSPRLMAAMAEIQAELDEVIELVPHPQEVLQRSNDQHRALIALLRRGDADGAAKLIREHVEGTEYFLAGMLPAS
jgi:GntR family transcriptional repressor for pyruvate dehydrogenase complex